MRVMSMRMTNLQMEELLAPTYKVGVYCRLSKEDEDIRIRYLQIVYTYIFILNVKPHHKKMDTQFRISI